MLNRHTILLTAAIYMLGVLPAAAAVVDLNFDDVVKGLKNRTRIAENSTETSQVDLGYVIKGGGALLLCEGGGGSDGPNGSCKDTTPASASDLLGFVADGSNDVITLYSDPNLDKLKLDRASLEKLFGPSISFLREGYYYDERTGNSGRIMDKTDVSVYIKKGRGFVRAFEVVSSTLEVPEPQAWTLMIAGFGLAGGRLRKVRRAASATPA